MNSINVQLEYAPLPRAEILGVDVTPMDLPSAVATLQSWCAGGTRAYVCCVAVHGLVVAQRNQAVRSALRGAAMATTDGMPLVWLSRGRGFGAARRVCGPDLLGAMAEASGHAVHRHYFYGGSPASLSRLVDALRTRYPAMQIVGWNAPPFRPLTQAEDEADVAAINAAKPDFVWIGLGMPKQELWMAAHQGRITATAMIGVGAAFDFHAGTKPRAPRWMQVSGLEWAFRLSCEPRRLAHRYIVDNSLFVFYLCRAAFGARRALTG
jgi:N-acetylglucosaminyldiphosphoundecaprenol N-acetyl-beta-D-mannosaminyltransferase